MCGYRRQKRGTEARTWGRRRFRCGEDSVQNIERRRADVGIDDACDNPSNPRISEMDRGEMDGGKGRVSHGDLSPLAS
jgi:hypothetical protein